MYTFHTLEVKQRPFDIISQLLSFSVNTHKLWKELRKLKRKRITQKQQITTLVFLLYIYGDYRFVPVHK